MKRFFCYFGFNQIEQRGFIVFTAIILLVLFVPFFYSLHRDNDDISYELVYFDDIKGEQDYDTMLETSPYVNNNDRQSSTRLNAKEISYFDFDPNNLDDASWRKLGFSDKQINVIKNYEAKGGKFYKKEDVAKIYVISDYDYNRIAPYIQIEKHKPTDRKVYDTPQKEILPVLPKLTNVNINTADTSEWKILYGIGSVFAKRIVKYREALGGFNSVDQLGEVYGLPQETLDNIKTHLEIDNDFQVNKIRLNSSTIAELLKHPYITRKQAQTIVNYRNQHGNFKNLESLSKIESLDNDFLRKIEPYLEY